MAWLAFLSSRYSLATDSSCKVECTPGTSHLVFLSLGLQDCATCCLNFWKLWLQMFCVLVVYSRAEIPLRVNTSWTQRYDLNPYVESQRETERGKKTTILLFSNGRVSALQGTGQNNTNLTHSMRYQFVTSKHSWNTVVFFFFPERTLIQGSEHLICELSLYSVDGKDDGIIKLDD